MAVTAFNMRTKKHEEVLDPYLVKFTVKGKNRYSVRGHGKDGTKMSVFISEDKFDKYKKEGMKVGAGDYFGSEFETSDYNVYDVDKEEEVVAPVEETEPKLGSGKPRRKSRKSRTSRKSKNNRKNHV